MSKILKSALKYKGPTTENLVEFIKTGLRKNADKTIIVDASSGRQWTGSRLESRITRVADYLQKECSLKKGEICTLYGEPNDHFVILILAVISAGGITNFVTDKYRVREVVDTSKQLHSNFFISTKTLLGNLREQLPEASPEKRVRVLSIDEKCEGYEKSFGPINHLLEESSDDSSSKQQTASLHELARQVDPSQLAVTQFSSGTTGKPKPIPRTHKNLCHLVASVDHEELMDLRPGQVISGGLPITHRPGLWALLACINGGSTLVLWRNTSNIEEALSIIEKYRVTILSASLTFLAELGNKGVYLKGNYDLSSLKHVITSGSKIVHEDLPNLIVKEFKLDTLKQCFGMTESGWVFLLESSLARKGNHLTVGHVVPGSEVAIMDRDTWKPVGEGVRGELAVRGPQVFPGYMDSEPFVFNRKDFLDDGWFRTGDQAYFDEHELVFIEGRYKELMVFPNSGRFFPNEIETIFGEHPAIEASCVINMGQNKSGFDVARAFVTLKKDCQATEEELLNFISEQAYEVMIEGGVKILDEFPRLQNGKVNKFALKAMKFDNE